MHPSEFTINDYVDGVLPAPERDGIARHVETCASCRLIADDLRAIAESSRALPPVDPPGRAWDRIAQAIGHDAPAEPKPRRVMFGVSPAAFGWAALAAAVLVVAVVVGLRTRPVDRTASGAGAVTVAPAGGDAALAEAVESELRQAEVHYDKAIQGLEQIANAEQGALDPDVAAALRKNLSVIDQAISESRAALQEQPASEPAQQSLLDSFKTKLTLLEDTVALINEMRKGNEAGAAKIISDLNQKGE